MVWIESSKTFLDNFLFGKGIGQDSCRVFFQNSDGSFSLLTDAHNIFLSVASQTGVLGLLAIAALLFSVLKISFIDGFKQQNTLLFSLGLGFFAAAFYQGLLGSFEDARHLWILTGLILATANNKNIYNLQFITRLTRIFLGKPFLNLVFRFLKSFTTKSKELGTFRISQFA
jgi:O-antigen ligase